MIDYYGLEDYRVDYSGLGTTGKPKLKTAIMHAQKRFEQRYLTPFNGQYTQSFQTFAHLANNGLSEREMFEMVDWYFGMISDRCVHSFNILRRLIDSYRLFVVEHRAKFRAGEDYYFYCSRIKENMNKRNQYIESLDDMISKICVSLPK